jgi:hypothetical protein
LLTPKPAMTKLLDRTRCRTTGLAVAPVVARGLFA